MSQNDSRYFLEVEDRQHKVWTSSEGYACYFHESLMGKPLIEALKKLAGVETLSEKEIEGKALFIYRHSIHARDLAGNNNLPASLKTSERELRKLHDLFEKLADHLEGLHHPAAVTLSRQGFFPILQAENMRSWMQAVRLARSEIDDEVSEPRGSSPKVVASEVSELAGRVFREITGERPTLTAHPVTNEVSGAWPEFLEGVFNALFVRASVASQAKAVSRKMREKEGN